MSFFQWIEKTDKLLCRRFFITLLVGYVGGYFRVSLRTPHFNMHVLILISIYCFDPHMFQWTFNLLHSTKGYTKQAKEALMSDLCHWSEESLLWINWYMASVFLWGLVSGLVELEKSRNCFHCVIRGLETQYRVVYLKLGTASLGVALVLTNYLSMCPLRLALITFVRLKMPSMWLAIKFLVVKDGGQSHDWQAVSFVVCCQS